MEDITDADCMRKKRVFKDFETKIQVNITICILKVIHYSWIIMKSNFKKGKIELLPGIDILVIIDKGIKG